MTNEQLAVAIKDGENKDLIPVLWERVYKVLYFKCDNEYRRRPEQFARCGLESWDLKQSCYTEVFLKAIEKYDPEKDLKFITYFKYPFMRMVEKMLGVLNGAQNTKPLDNCVSLDAPINALEDGEPLTLADMISDEDQEPHDTKITRRDMKKIVRAAVWQLEEPYGQFIALHYFKRKSMSEIGELNGISRERVHQQIKKRVRETPQKYRPGIAFLRPPIRQHGKADRCT